MIIEFCLEKEIMEIIIGHCLGGRVENKEKIIEALKREVKEETNQEILANKYMLTSYDMNNYSIAIIYKCEIKKGKRLRFPEKELPELKWFDINNLPKDELTERQKEWIYHVINNIGGMLEI